MDSPRVQTSRSAVPSEPDGSKNRQALTALFSIDSRALTAVRIGLAIIILVEVAITPPPLELTDPLTLARLLVIPFAIALLVGYRTRLATILTWVAYGLPLRAALLEAGGTVHLGNYCLALVLFWCIFLPLGGHLAIDSRGVNGAPTRILSVASAGLLLQMFVIYFWAGATKDMQEWVLDATALQTVLGHPEHGSVLGQALTAFPSILAIASVATVALETIGSVLLFAPVRGLARRRIVIATVFIVFHAGMALYMTLELFPYVMAVAWLVFFPSVVWDLLTRQRGAVTVTADRNRPRNALASIALAYVWVSSLVTWMYYPAREGLPSVIQEVGRHLLLYQQWAMFSLPSSL